MKVDRKIKLVFAESRLEKELERVKIENKELYKSIERAFYDISKNPECGIRIQNKLIPKSYIQKYGIDNLRKYNLSSSWRLMYSVAGNNIEILAIVLEWLPHKEYERRFGYS